jgi:hypothetical protein
MIKKKFIYNPITDNLDLTVLQDLQSVIDQGGIAEYDDFTDPSKTFILKNLRAGLSNEYLFNTQGNVGFASLSTNGETAYHVANEQGSFFGVKKTDSQTVIGRNRQNSFGTNIDRTINRLFTTTNPINNSSHRFVVNGTGRMRLALDEYVIDSLFFTPNTKFTLGIGYTLTGTGDYQNVWFGFTVVAGLVSQSSPSSVQEAGWTTGVDLTGSEIRFIRQSSGLIQMFVDGVLWLTSTSSIDTAINTNRNKVLVWKPQTLGQSSEISAP